MGDAAALSHHHRRGAPAPAPAQGVGRARRRRFNDLTPADWLSFFERTGEAVRAAVAPLTGTPAGRAELSRGAGGDTTLELDHAAESVVFAGLDQLAARGERFSVLSEEVGSRSYGADYPLVLVDPVDGSLNAKQGVPLFGLMLAVLDGPNVEDAVAGLVLNLSTGELWTATRGGGAERGGRRVVPLQRALPGRIELLGLESTPRALQAAKPLVERASKIRILGSMAISIALAASGGFDTFCAPIPVRVFDMAASLLILSETGGVATDLDGTPIGGMRCDLETRSTLVCAPTPELHREALAMLAAR